METISTTSASKAKEAQASSFLLNLPPEILTKVLGVLDPSSFSMVLMTCKTIRHAVLNNPHVLHDQLRSIPGLHQCHPQTCVQDPSNLLQTFMKRAANHVLNGVAILGDVDSIVGKKFKVKTYNGLIGPQISPKSDCGRWIACHDQDNENLVVYKAPTWSGDTPALTNPIPIDTDWLKLKNPRVAYIQFGETDGIAGRHVFLYVLYRYTLSNSPPNEPADSKRRKTFDSVNSKYRFTVKLVVYDLPSADLETTLGKCARPVHVVDIPGNASEFARPAAIALKWVDSKKELVDIRDGVSMSLSPIMFIAVAWEINHEMEDEDERLPNGNLTRRVVYVNNVEVFPATDVGWQHVASWPKITRSLIKTNNRVKSLSFDGQRLVLFTKDRFNSSHYIKGIGTAHNAVRAIRSPDLGTMDVFFGYWDWPKLQFIHNHNNTVDILGQIRCVVTNIHMGFIKWLQWNDSGYFLTKSQGYNHTCIDPLAGMPFAGESLDNVIVAKFVDTAKKGSPHRAGENSVVAISDTGHRVAIATWDRVLLYAVSPEAFLEPNIGSLSLATRPDGCMSVTRRGIETQPKLQKSQEDPQTDDSDDTSSRNDIGSKRKRRVGDAFRNYHTEWPLDDETVVPQYFTNAGMGFYRNNLYYPHFKKRIVALRPIILPAKGVIYSMNFLNDDTLVAFTDRGFVRWYWGTGRSGRSRKMEEFPLSVTGGCSFCNKTLCHCLLHASPLHDSEVWENGGPLPFRRFRMRSNEREDT